MSPDPPTNNSSSNYQVIFDNALKAYKTKTGKDLKSDPLLHRLESCNSPDAVLTLLQQQIPGFVQSGSSDERLTNWVNPTVNVLYNFAGTIGGAVSLTYPPAGVIFTGISSLLSAVLATGADQSEFIDLFERIENFFIRLGTYVELPSTVEMTDIIVKVMVDVLLVFALVTRRIKQGKIKRFLKKLIGRSDMKDALQRFDTLTQEEGRMAIAQGLKATHGVGNDVRDIGDGVKVAINKVDAVTAAVLDGGENVKVEIQQVARGVSDLAKDAGDEKRNQMRQDIKKWLSPADPFINFNTANEAHYDGTAEWFAQSSVFKSWKESGSLIWIHVKPGSGKSVLSSTIIQNINGLCNTRTAHLAFFFFDFKDAGKQDARALLSSIIVQLGNRSVGFFNVLLGLYSTHSDGKQPSISALTQCLEDMLKAPEELPVYLIIDAIDECPNTNGIPSSRDKVLAIVERFVALKLPNFHLCVTSRPEADIRISLEPLTSTSNSISLHDESGQEKDIVEFVTSVVRTDKTMRRWQEEDKELVINTLSEKASGMFRWVFCQLETLRPCFPSSVRHILAELPETLDATYERILREIPKSNQVHAHRLLQCLTAAIRPLLVEELAEVLAIDFDGAGGIPKLNEGFRWADQEQAVLSACSSLIAIVKHEDSRRVQFSHFSVKEYLTSDRLATSESNALRYHHIDLESAHTIMAQVCLSVVFRLDDNMDKETIESYPLANYVGEFLVNHVEVGNVLSRIGDEVDTLFDPDKPHFKTWFWLREGDLGDLDLEELDFKVDPGSDHSDDSSPERSSSDQSSSGRSFPKYIPQLPHLICAIICESTRLMQQLILTHAQHALDATDMYGKTALHYSSYLSRFEEVRILIEHAADINVQDNVGCTPLHYAMASNHEDEEGDNIRCVRLLLERGANPGAQNNRGSTPLHLASFDLGLENVQILIKNVTNINLRNNRGQTALHKVWQECDTDIMNSMLNRGADLDAQDNSGSTPLHLAVSSSDSSPHLVKRAVGLLLESGANINLQNDQGRTALHEAAWRGHGDTDTIRLILNHGADADAQDNGGLTPLHLAVSDASQNLMEKVVGLLLEHGANINLRNDQGRTALHEAAWRGDTDIIRRILNHGADVDAQDNGGSTPLHVIMSKVPADSVDYGPFHVLGAIRLLLEHGASVHRENNRGETPFQVAESRGVGEITELLSMRIQSE